MTSILRDQLHQFVDRQVDAIAATPVPPEMAALGASERFTPDEVRAMWLGASIASRIGMALTLDPSPFVEPWPAEDEPEPARLAV
jgi:hypothetical protein